MPAAAPVLAEATPLHAPDGPELRIDPRRAAEGLAFFLELPRCERLRLIEMFRTLPWYSGENDGLVTQEIIYDRKRAIF